MKKEKLITIIISVVVVVLITAMVVPFAVIINKNKTTAEQQVTLINTTLDNMKATDKTLNDSITALTGRVTTLEGELVEVNTKISALQTNSATKAELEKVKTDLQTQIASLNTAIEALQAKDTELQTQIAVLQNSLANEISGVMTWSDDTFLSIADWNTLKEEIYNGISSLNVRVDNVEALIEALTERIDENKTNIADIANRLEILESENALLKIKVNCLRGDHEWDASQTTYEWILNADIESSDCDTIRICKHCWKEVRTTNGAVAYDNYIFTADFTDWDGCTTQTYDIRDISGLNTQSIEAAVSILVGDGTGDENGEINLSLNMPEEADNDMYDAVVKGLKNAGDGKVNITIKGVDTIIGSAFMNCKKLKSVTFGDEVKVIDDLAFSGCRELCIINFGSGIESIGVDAFASCEKLTSVVIPDNVTSLGSRAFYYCTGLSSITFGSGVTVLNEQLLQGCSALSNITFRGGITECSESAFAAVTSPATEVYPTLMLAEGQRVMVFDNDTDKYAAGEDFIYSGTEFCGCTFDRIITAHNIEIDAREMSADDLKTEISSYVTKGAVNFAITLAADASYDVFDAIVKGMTNASNGSVTLVLKGDITSIPTDAFRDCEWLRSISIPDSVTSIDDRAFYGSALETITFGENSILTNIESWAFQNCSNLSSIIVPKGVTSIGFSAFQGCSSLVSITLPDGVKIIEDDLFFDCVKLESVAFANDITSIKMRAFYNCSSLKEIIIPKSVESLGFAVFADCTSLVIRYEGTIEEWNAIIKIEESGSWDEYIKVTEVVCSDGTVSI